MEWISLGTLQPTFHQWQIFPIPTFSRTFKLTFLGNLDRLYSYLRIRQQFTTTEVSFSQRIYPKSESVIFEMPIPDDLKLSGQTARHIAVAKFFRYRTTLEIDHQVTLEALE